jgi:hypothetical protein
MRACFGDNDNTKSEGPHWQARHLGQQAEAAQKSELV